MWLFQDGSWNLTVNGKRQRILGVKLGSCLLFYFDFFKNAGIWSCREEGMTEEARLWGGRRGWDPDENSLTPNCTKTTPSPEKRAMRVRGLMVGDGIGHVRGRPWQSSSIFPVKQDSRSWWTWRWREARWEYLLLVHGPSSPIHIQEQKIAQPSGWMIIHMPGRKYRSPWLLCFNEQFSILPPTQGG